MKIKYTLLEKLVNLTNKEVDFLLYIAHYQDDKGNVKGIYYRDVCNECRMCKQTFYDVLRSLKLKGIIEYSLDNQDYNITILNNDFSYKGSYNEGYINVSRRVFDTKKFKMLRAKEKVLMLLFMKVTHENAKSYQIGCQKFYKKYMELLGVTKRILRGYLHSLRSFFSVGIKEGKYFITFLVSVFRERRQESEVDQFMSHNVKVSCRRSKIKFPDESAVKDTTQLMKQYREAAREVGRDIINVIGDCIQISALEMKKKCLNAKRVHQLVRNVLGLTYMSESF